MHPTFAVAFSIDQLGGGAYGSRAWETVWQYCDPEVAVGAVLFEGDSSATLQGLERVYVCAFYGLSGTTQSQFQSNLQKCKPTGYLRCDASIFLASEPLRMCGVVIRTPQGINIDESSGSGWAKEGLKKALKQRISYQASPRRNAFYGLCPNCNAQVKVEIVGWDCDLSWIRCQSCREDLHYQVRGGLLALRKACDTARERAADTSAKIRAMKERVQKASRRKTKKWWQLWKP